MQSPKVSIIVPCWGVEKYLDRCVESLVEQALHDIEIILVDDVSPDRVPEMCDIWAQKDSRIRVIHKHQNEGLGMACNSGIEVATGEFIAFCDSDDWVDKEMYETMYNAAKEHKAEAVFTGLKRVDIHGNTLGTLPHRKKLEILNTKEDIEAFALDMVASEPTTREDRTIQMSAKVVLYKSTIIRGKSLRFVSEREVPSEDLHFNLNFLRHCSCICSLPHSFYNYRVNTASISRKKNLNIFKTSKKLFYYLNKECKELQYNEEYAIRCQRLLLGQARSCVKLCLQWNISRAEKKQIIQEMSNDRIWNDIYEEYPLNKMPFPHKLFAYAMKYKLYIIMALLMKLS